MTLIIRTVIITTKTHICICTLTIYGNYSLYLSSTWLKNINGDLTSFDMELLEARDAAQNQPFWRMLALYSATHP